VYVAGTTSVGQMMLPSHLLGVLAVGLLIGLLRGRAFRKHEWLLAIGFGVVIDLDHVIAFPAYVAAAGAAALSPSVALHYGSAWQGFMHTGWALLVLAPAMLWWRSWWPAVFWGLHMVQDFVIARHYVVWGSAAEWLVVALLALAVWGLVAIQRALLRSRASARRGSAEAAGTQR
jgi:hypothetical protein